jgi:enoyl-CoA hydratase/carnithine racemase
MTTTTPDGFLRRLTSYQRIRFEVDDDGIGIITLACPEKLNAFDKDMLAEIRDVVWR